MEIAAAYYADNGPAREAAIAFGNVGEMHLLLGNIQTAIKAAYRAVEFADKSEDRFQEIKKRSSLANCYHQAGDYSRAGQLFAKAEELEATFYPEYPLLDSVSGYHYCDFLLDKGERQDVRRRGEHCLATAEEASDPISLGLAHLTLAEIHSHGTRQFFYEINKALDHLRDAGTQNHLPRALLVRGQERDFSEVLRIAKTSEMRLFLADYYLSLSRRSAVMENIEEARRHFDRAEKLINDTGYGRRLNALEILRKEVGR